MNSLQIIIIIQFIVILLILLNNDCEDKIVLKRSKFLKGCFEKWTYLKGIPIKFEMLWQEEIDAYFNKLKKEKENNDIVNKERRFKKQNKRSKEANVDDNAKIRKR